MKIYIAHNFAARIALRDTIKDLEFLGHTVTSSWITDDTHIKVGTSAQSAIRDLTDLDAADALILCVEQFGDSPGRGKYVEFGYAIAKGKKVYLYGHNPGCVFYSLPQVIQLNSLLELPWEPRE